MIAPSLAGPVLPARTSTTPIASSPGSSPQTVRHVLCVEASSERANAFTRPSTVSYIARSCPQARTLPSIMTARYEMNVSHSHGHSHLVRYNVDNIVSRLSGDYVCMCALSTWLQSCSKPRWRVPNILAAWEKRGSVFWSRTGSP